MPRLGLAAPQHHQLEGRRAELHKLDVSTEQLVRLRRGWAGEVTPPR